MGLSLLSCIILFILQITQGSSAVSSQTRSYVSINITVGVNISITLNNYCENISSLRCYVFKLGLDPASSGTTTIISIDKYVKALNANEEIDFVYQRTPGYIGELEFVSDSDPLTSLSNIVSVQAIRTYNTLDPDDNSTAFDPMTIVLIIAPPFGSADQYATGLHPFTPVQDGDRSSVMSGVLTRCLTRAVRGVQVIDTGDGFAASANFFVHPTWPRSRIEGTYNYNSVACTTCYSNRLQNMTLIPIGTSHATKMCSSVGTHNKQYPVTSVVTEGYTPHFAAVNGANTRALVIHLIAANADEAIHVHASIRAILRTLPAGVTSPTLETPRPYADNKLFDVVYVISHDLLDETDMASDYDVGGIPRLVWAARNIVMPCYSYPSNSTYDPSPSYFAAYANVVGMYASEGKTNCGNITATVVSRVFVGAGAGGNMALAAVLWGFGSSALVLEPSQTLLYAPNKTPVSPGCCESEPCDVTTCCPYNAVDWLTMCPYVNRLLPLRRIVFATTKGGGYVTGTPVSPSFFASGCPGADPSMLYNNTVVETLFEEQMPARSYHAAINRMLTHIFKQTGGVI